MGNWDRHVVQDILKEIAQTQQVDLNAQKRFKGALSTSCGLFLAGQADSVTVVVINEADLLSRDAQSALRRTMESEHFRYSA